MDEATAQAVGRAVTVAASRGVLRPRIVIGRDTRISGTMLEAALEVGVREAGGVAILVGVLPTPGVAFITRAVGADAGVIVSASHNPYQDNGIKVFSGDGFKLSDAQEATLEDLVLEALVGGRSGAAAGAAVAAVAETMEDAPIATQPFCERACRAASRSRG